MMKTLARLALFASLFILGLLAAGALAWEGGEVTCTTPGCRFRLKLTIGCSENVPPIVYGYCAKERIFPSIKLKSWKEYGKPLNCPHCRRPLWLIVNSSGVAKIPCPRCGHLTLKYQRQVRLE